MRKIGLLLSILLFSNQLPAQESSEAAKTMLDAVAEKMNSYSNMVLQFNSTLVNEEAGITNDPAIYGAITLQGEKYKLNYLGNNFLFDGEHLAIINLEEKEIAISEGDLEEEDGFIYPSKLATFYKEGYTFNMGVSKTVAGHKIQFIDLTPIDSDSEIVKVILGIHPKSLHIHSLQQLGTNGSLTTFTITSFKSNQNLSVDFFTFNEAKYLKEGYIID